MNKKNKTIWSQPWGYVESFFIIGGLFFTALMMDIFYPVSKLSLSYPYNVILLCVVVYLAITFQLLSKKYKFLRWFSSLPASIVSIIFFMVMTLFLALTPPNFLNSLGLPDLRETFVYFSAYGFILITLGSTVVKRIMMKSIKDVGFFANHLGLWLVLAAAGFGAGDTQTLSLYTKYDNPEWRAIDKYDNIFALDFAAELLKFDIKHHEPKFMLFNTKNNNILKDKGRAVIFELQTEKYFKWNGYTFINKKINNKDIIATDRYLANQSVAFVNIITPENDTLGGTITSGNDMMAPVFLKINEQISIGMTKPEASLYRSKVKFYHKNQRSQTHTIEVNKPISINGMRVYQQSYIYDYNNGQYVSILQIVKDPWLAYVYIGALLMICGSIILIFSNKLIGD